ncbi:hypothetical protein CDAR_587581 [Caerostris darwini]|uniref:Uncharacterized protein n=1 Tax=Caerostris darwini TaxID=1538125 RepID=A0AAV4SKH3_9ARAC|nr:hypothetical protein CDAR_587581 [Caerostris darwini]
MELPDSFTVRGETICSKICGQIRNLKRHGTKPLRICVSDIHYTSGEKARRAPINRNLMELPDSFTVRGETICSKICGQIRNLKRHGTKPLRICVSDIHYTSGGSGGEKERQKRTKKGIKS